MAKNLTAELITAFAELGIVLPDTFKIAGAGVPALLAAVQSAVAAKKLQKQRNQTKDDDTLQLSRLRAHIVALSREMQPTGKELEERTSAIAAAMTHRHGTAQMSQSLNALPTLPTAHLPPKPCKLDVSEERAREIIKGLRPWLNNE